MEKKQQKKPSKLKINVANINDKFQIKKKQIKRLAKLVINAEKRSEAEVCIIFVTHDYITQLNRKFLKRNCTTDVLAFSFNSTTINGEIYVNLDKVAEQAEEYNVPILDEMFRIIIHGLLHLSGYNDDTTLARNKMTAQEDYYLTIVKQEGIY